MTNLTFAIDPELIGAYGIAYRTQLAQGSELHENLILGPALAGRMNETGSRRLLAPFRDV